MRKVLLSLVAAAAMSSTGLTSANAAPVSPAALQIAINDTAMIEDVRWVRSCRHNWRNSRVRCVQVWRPGRGHYWRSSRRWR
jgi:hypothetical protein